MYRGNGVGSCLKGVHIAMSLAIGSIAAAPRFLFEQERNHGRCRAQEPEDHSRTSTVPPGRHEDPKDERSARPFVQLRDGIEQLTAEDYERCTYYERWAKSLAYTLVARGVISEEQLAARVAAVKARQESEGAA